MTEVAHTTVSGSVVLFGPAMKRQGPLAGRLGSYLASLDSLLDLAVLLYANVWVERGQLLRCCLVWSRLTFARLRSRMCLNSLEILLPPL